MPRPSFRQRDFGLRRTIISIMLRNMTYRVVIPRHEDECLVHVSRGGDVLVVAGFARFLLGARTKCRTQPEVEKCRLSNLAMPVSDWELSRRPDRQDRCGMEEATHAGAVQGDATGGHGARLFGGLLEQPRAGSLPVRLFAARRCSSPTRSLSRALVGRVFGSRWRWRTSSRGRTTLRHGADGSAV